MYYLRYTSYSHESNYLLENQPITHFLCLFQVMNKVRSSSSILCHFGDFFIIILYCMWLVFLQYKIQPYLTKTRQFIDFTEC